MLIAKHIKEATFLERLNRFLGIVNMNDENFECFIPNSGRMKELLIKGRKVWLKKVQTGNRKTEYDLIAVEHEGKVISIDSRVSNKLVHHFLMKKLIFNFEFDEIKPEYTHGTSRFDFFLKKDEMKYLIEVKSCTLVKDGLALFPDAPTVRGARHVMDLVKALNEGFKTMIIFIIQRDDAESFAPNEKTDKNFSSQLTIAKEAGVLIKALASKVYIDENDLFIEPSEEVDLKF